MERNDIKDNIGYGRDTDGTIEVKHSGGSWAAIDIGEPNCPDCFGLGFQNQPGASADWPTIPCPTCKPINQK